jgi:hypothetical protein
MSEFVCTAPRSFGPVADELGLWRDCTPLHDPESVRYSWPRRIDTPGRDAQQGPDRVRQRGVLTVPDQVWQLAAGGLR